MKFGWKVVLALFVAMLLAGCATTMGRDYDPSKINQFVPGKTTLSEVEAILGQPQEQETESDGGTRIHYQYVSSKSSVGTYIPGVDLFDHSASVKGKDTFLYFDRNGKYLRAENNQSNM